MKIRITKIGRNFSKGGNLTREDDYKSSSKPYPTVKSSDFAGGNRSYPIPTKANAIDALRLAGLHGRADVRAKVFAKYPGLKKQYGGYINNIYPDGGSFSTSDNEGLQGNLTTKGINVNKMNVSKQGLNFNQGTFDTLMGIGSAAASLIPIAGPFIAAGMQGIKTGVDAGNAANEKKKAAVTGKQTNNTSIDTTGVQNSITSIADMVKGLRKPVDNTMGNNNFSTNLNANANLIQTDPNLYDNSQFVTPETTLDLPQLQACGGKMYADGGTFSPTASSASGALGVKKWKQFTKNATMNVVPNTTYNMGGTLKMFDDGGVYGSGGWIKNAVNPAHKGYCTPMTKSTCTPHRKAFAMRAKAHFKAEGGNIIDNGISDSAIYDDGGPMLTEFQGGGTHNQNPLGGIPVGQNALVENNETKFSPQNPNMDEFIFSEREKAKNGKSYAQLSKSIKNKFKLREDDKMAKEAMDKQLSQLAEQQETQKAIKAEKLMQKAIELNPQIANQLQQVPQGQQMPQGQPQMQQNANPNMQPQLPMDYGGQMKYQGGGDWYNTLQGVQNAVDFRNLNPGNVVNQPMDEDLSNLQPDVVNQQPLFRKGMKNVFQGIYTPTEDNTNPITTLPVETQPEYYAKNIGNFTPPKSMIGLNAGMYGTQAAAEMLRLGLTPNSPLTGNVNFERVNPYAAELLAKQQAQQTEANLRDTFRNSGANQGAYLSGVTTGLGNINATAGQNVANINLQGRMTNAQIQHQEAQLNKQLEAARKEIMARDIANRSNQMGAVGAGLVQNLNTSLGDESRRKTDLYALQFMDKENYKMFTKDEADKFNKEHNLTGDNAVKEGYNYVAPNLLFKKKGLGGKISKIKKYKV